MNKRKKHDYQSKCVTAASDALCIAYKNLRLAFDSGDIGKSAHDDYIVLLAQVSVARIQVAGLISEYDCVIWR